MLNVREFYCFLSPVDVNDDDVQKQQPCLYQGDDHQLHPGDRQSSSPVRCFPDNWIQSVLSSISEAAPNNVYHNTRKEDKIDSFINLEFREIWRNSLVMFRYEEEVVQISSPSPPPLVIRYPTINITKCNICSIANVPKPQKYPILDVQLIQSFICSLADMFGMEQMMAVIGSSMLSSPKMDVGPTEDLATISSSRVRG